MRLTGGEARGRRLKAPRGLHIRPTADRVREALFDILGARIRGARFLDVYAGTGAVGCEALSRGAARVVFVERQRSALRLIRSNLGLGSWSPAAEIMAGEASGSLSELVRDGARFDIVFLDPPYDDPELPDSWRLAARLVGANGLLVLEHRSAAATPGAGALLPHRSYRYGDTSLTVWRPGSEAERP
ncbi:MAG: 16S rRNA (guanine(966)-N(2))-methyltransferase RsmD [Acidobacteria bacterium]|nr:16S rRNA (guanine(966)-N(2))-methyltransferase RsmD [Acidobacteriota bacterium]